MSMIGLATAVASSSSARVCPSSSSSTTQTLIAQDLTATHDDGSTPVVGAVVIITKYSDCERSHTLSANLGFQAIYLWCRPLYSTPVVIQYK